MSVQFADIGEQEVKNIPSPVHAYTLSSGIRRRRRAAASSSQTKDRGQGRAQRGVADRHHGGEPRGRCGGSDHLFRGDATRVARRRKPASRRKPPARTRARAKASAAPGAPSRGAGAGSRTVHHRPRTRRHSVELPAAPDHKAFAISTTRAASPRARRMTRPRRPPRSRIARGCWTRSTRKHAARSMRWATPWSTRAGDRRCRRSRGSIAIRQSSGRSLRATFRCSTTMLARRPRSATPQARKSKALAISPQGTSRFMFDRKASMRRRAAHWRAAARGPAFRVSSSRSTTNLVVPIPTSMKVVGLFHAVGNPLIAPESGRVSRSALAMRPTAGTRSRSARADGRRLALKAASEQAAVDGALADCARQDRNCRVIAIGPFAVEPN